MARPGCSPDSAANTAGLNHHFDSAGESGYSGFFQTASLGLHWSRARVVVFPVVRQSRPENNADLLLFLQGLGNQLHS